MEDKRQYSRFATGNIPCHCTLRPSRYDSYATARSFEGVIINVSSSGMMLRTGFPLPEDAWLELSFVLDQEPIHAIAQPAWARQDDHYYYYGFKFFDSNGMYSIGSMFGVM